MSAYGRLAGEWVETSLAGSARLGGQWVPFGGSPPGPAYESLAWPNATPAFTDSVDGSYTYNMGIRFHLLSGRLCYGVRWRVPDTAPGPVGGPHVATLWDTNGEVRMAFKEFTAVPGGYQDILFDTPVLLSASPAEYVASVFTWHYVYRVPSPSSGWLVESPSLNVRGDKGRLGSTSAPTGYPATSYESLYYVSPIVGTS